jgi:hypothetical protein
MLVTFTWGMSAGGERDAVYLGRALCSPCFPAPVVCDWYEVPEMPGVLLPSFRELEGLPHVHVSCLPTPPPGPWLPNG